MTHTSGERGPEIHHRITKSSGYLKPFKTVVMAKSALPIANAVHLLESFVLSGMFYNAHVWANFRASDLSSLQARLAQTYASVTRYAPKKLDGSFKSSSHAHVFSAVERLDAATL